MLELQTHYQSQTTVQVAKFLQVVAEVLMYSTTVTCIDVLEVCYYTVLNELYNAIMQFI